MANVVVFTENYPYRCFTEGVFIKPDLEALCQEFERVIVVPLWQSGPLEAINLPKVEVDTSLAESALTLHKALRLPHLLSRFSLKKLPQIFKESPLRRLHKGAFYAMNASVALSLVKKILKRRDLRPDNTLLYTFWFNHLAQACAYLHNKDGYKMVGRAHGYDVYENLGTYRPPCLRKMALDAYEALYAVSRKTQQYLQHTYPDYADIIQLRYLGSLRPGNFITHAHKPEEKALTFFSCSRVIDIKNLGLNLEVVTEMAKINPGLSIKWIHVGDGPLLDSLRSQAKEKMKSCSNLKIELTGSLPNDKVTDIYRTEKIDWTMLFSTSEGLGIALVESISYGVPALITRTGGMPEVINDTCGIVYDRQSTAQEIAKTLTSRLSETEWYSTLKFNASQRWLQCFQAIKLRQSFAKELRCKYKET